MIKVLFLSLTLVCALQAAEPIVKIVAKVGPGMVTNRDLEQAITPFLMGMTQQERDSVEGKKKVAETKARLLDQIISEKLMILAAEKGPAGWKEAVDGGRAGANPYLPNSVEIEDEMEKIFDETRARFASIDEFEVELARQRTSVTEFRNKLRERVKDRQTAGRMQKIKEQEFRPSLRVSDEETKKFYEENKAAFAVGDQVNLRHIVYGFADKAKAEAALVAIKASANSKSEFIAVAKKDSKDDLTAGKGGRLGWIEKGGLRWADVEKAAFGVKPGQMAGPVRSEEGWHLLWVEERKPGELRDFDTVRQQVRNMIYRNKVDAKMAEWMDDLKKQFFVEYSGN